MWQVGIIALCVFGVSIANVTPHDSECGKLPAGITSEGIQPHHLPWVVRLGYHRRENVVFNCIGTLISRQIVVTNAHCVHHAKPFMVQLQDCEETNCNNTRNINVSTFITHPAYTPLDPSYINDIALIKLEKNTHNKVGHYICLPKSTYQTDSLLGSKLVVPGWSINENGTKFQYSKNSSLRTITVSAVSDEECKLQYGKQQLKIHNSHLCASGAGKEPCLGDASAPLHSIQGSPPQAVLAGILVSGPNDCANSPLPTIYTNVGAHVQWIKNAMLALQ